jgi:hypothetical protein
LIGLESAQTVQGFFPQASVDVPPFRRADQIFPGWPIPFGSLRFSGAGRILTSKR